MLWLWETSISILTASVIQMPPHLKIKDTLDALGLKIHNFPTHRHGNPLDILATDVASSFNTITCQPGPFLSDHWSIECTTDIRRADITRKMVLFRKIRYIDTQKFGDDVVNQPEIDNDCYDIDVLVCNLEIALCDTVEANAPLTTKSVPFDINVHGILVTHIKH